MTAELSKWDLYELCAQNPPQDAALLDAIYRLGFEDADVPTPEAPEKSPHLCEDFCGSAALSRAWADRFPDRSATAIDLDAGVVELARARAALAGLLPDVHIKRGDALAATDPADLIFVGNFSICELHTRDRLVAYFRAARARIRPGGMIACDLYGGTDAHTLGEIEQEEQTTDGRPILYTWEQRHADPTTGRVVNAMHFRVGEPPEIEIRDAFIYDWRLWSITELRDAMCEAGFARTEVFHRFDHAQDDEGNTYAAPIVRGDELEDSYFVFVVGRA